jgi:hypothetical protein
VFNNVITYMLTRNMRIEADLVDQLFNSGEKRLARTLLLLARYGDAHNPQRTLPKISQETLAEMIGATRPRVNFFMNKFRKLGFIEYNGRPQDQQRPPQHRPARLSRLRLSSHPRQACLQTRPVSVAFSTPPLQPSLVRSVPAERNRVNRRFRRGSRPRTQGRHMPNDHIPPEQHRQQPGGVPEKAGDSRQDAEQDRGFTEEQRDSAESARNDAEQSRRLAEEAREARDRHREALETVREERERLREAGEIARSGGEEARVAGEAARHAAIEALNATADTLQATLEQMNVVEDLRRTLREIRDANKLDSN